MDITENDLTNAILDELSAEWGEPRQPGDVDTGQLAQRLGVSENAARRWMTQKVRDGLFTSHTVRNDRGRRVIVWRRAGVTV
jgi:predicted ArsR family transcriptional regulator